MPTPIPIFYVYPDIPWVKVFAHLAGQKWRYFTGKCSKLLLYRGHLQCSMPCWLCGMTSVTFEIRRKAAGAEPLLTFGIHVVQCTALVFTSDCNYTQTVIILLSYVIISVSIYTDSKV